MRNRKKSIILEEIIYDDQDYTKEDILTIEKMEDFFNKNYVNLDIVKIEVYSEAQDKYCEVMNASTNYYNFSMQVQEPRPENALMQYRISFNGE